MSFLKLPKQYHPDFSTPNKQPLSNETIDRLDWAGKSAVSYNHNSLDVTHTTAFNYKNGLKVDSAGTGTIDMSREVDGMGSDPFAFSFIADITPVGMAYASQSFSIFDSNNGLGRNTFSLKYSFFGGDKSFILSGRGNFGATITVKSADSITSDADLNKRHIIVGVFSKDRQVLYDNGVLIAESTASLNTYNVSEIDTTPDVLNGNFTGELGSVSFFSTEFNNAQIVNLSSNAYRFLKSKTPPGYFVPAVASGNTITANQTEAGDTQSAALTVTVEVSANQSEAGDSQAALINNIVQISANQSEVGDTQSASLVGIVTSEITANQTEDGDIQTATISNIIQISASQNEEGDSQTANLDNIVQITANQAEAGDTQAAALIGVLTSTIAATQQEDGDTQNASLSNIVQITSNQVENGDSQTANLSNIVQINASQSEVGDTQSAAIVGEITSSISASQLEVGDTQVANISNIIQLFANQSEAGDSQAAAIIGESVVSCFTGYVTIEPQYSGYTTIEPQYNGYVKIQ